jgi:hypothetical protein
MNKNYFKSTLLPFFWMLPFIAVMVYGAYFMVSTPGGWSLFDEIGVFSRFQDGWTVATFVNWDWQGQGRFRPMIHIQTYVYYLLFKSDVTHLRWMRYVEFSTFFVLLAAWLRLRLQLHWPFVALAVGLVLKANPVYEMLEVWTLAELLCLNLFLLACLLPWHASNNKELYLEVMRGLILILMTMTKEPMGLFVAIPYALHGSRRQTILATVLGFSFVLFIRISLHGSYGDLTRDADAAWRAFHGFSGNLRPIFLLCILGLVGWWAQGQNKVTLVQSSAIRQWPLFFPPSIAIVYCYALAGKAPDYTYHYAPAVLILVVYAILLLQKIYDAQSKEGKHRLWRYGILTGTLFFVLFHTRWLPLRLHFTAEKHQLRNEILLALKTHVPAHVAVASNMTLDTHGLGYLAGLEENIRCAEIGFTFEKCCAHANYIYYSREGYDYPRLKSEMATSGIVIAQGEGWMLGRCRVDL